MKNTSFQGFGAMMALLPLVMGTVITGRNYCCQTYDDNYDNIAAPATATMPITNYNGLLYRGWDVINHNSPTTPVEPHTEPNVIFAAATTDLMQIGSVTMHPFGSVLRGPQTKAFDLYSFYFGCTQLDANGAIDTAVGCTIAVTGYYITGQQTPVATYAFAPPSAMGDTPDSATLPSSFVGLQNVTFGIAQGDAVGGATGTVINVDDLVHCNYKY